MAAKKNLSIVLVQGALVVGYSRHVLDDDGVVGVLALGVQDVVSLDHVIDNVGLGDLLGAELLLGAQVLSRVVNTLDDVGEALRVGGPLRDNLVESVGGLEVTVAKLAFG